MVLNRGATSYYISMDIMPILTPRGSAKFLNNSARKGAMIHNRLKNTVLSCREHVGGCLGYLVLVRFCGLFEMFGKSVVLEKTQLVLGQGFYDFQLPKRQLTFL